MLKHWTGIGALALVALGAILVASACGGDDNGKATGTREISITGAWARSSAVPSPQAGDMQDMTPGAMAAGARSAAYMVIKNTGTVDDALVGIESDVAEATEVHETVMDGETASMRPAPRIELKAGDTLELKPGGYHVMFIGLNRPLEAGKTISVTLEFEQAGSIPVTVEVRAQ